MENNKNKEQKKTDSTMLFSILKNMIFLLPFIIFMMVQPAMATEMKNQAIKQGKKIIKSGKKKVFNKNGIQEKIISAHKNLRIFSMSKDFNTLSLEDGTKIFNALKNKDHSRIVQQALKSARQNGSVDHVLSQKTDNLLATHF